MKTIGVLGGFGPQATMDFERRLHAVAQLLIPQQGNSGHPPLIVYYHRRPPFVMQDERTPVFPLQPDPDLLEAAHWLGTRADFLVITANGPHIIQAQIEQASGRKVLSMIEVTLAEVRRRGWRKIGVLGFGDPSVPVYARPLGQLGLAFELITPELQGPLNSAVALLWEGRATAEDTQAVREAVTYLRATGRRHHSGPQTPALQAYADGLISSIRPTLAEQPFGCAGLVNRL
jgi:aspartate/glutamate racemase